MNRFNKTKDDLFRKSLIKPSLWCSYIVGSLYFRRIRFLQIMFDYACMKRPSCTNIKSDYDIRCIWASMRENMFSGLANKKRLRLISAFGIRLLESIISKLATSKIPVYWLITVAENASLGMIWSEIPRSDFRMRRLI